MDLDFVDLWPSGLRRRSRDPTVVSSNPRARTSVSVEVTSDLSMLISIGYREVVATL